MPSSAEAEEDKRRKVSGSAAPPQFLERPSALIQNPRYAPRHGRWPASPPLVPSTGCSPRSQGLGRGLHPRGAPLDEKLRRGRAGGTSRIRTHASPLRASAEPSRVFPAYGARKRQPRFSSPLVIGWPGVPDRSRANLPFQAACGDPDCAPIDTIVRIIYEGQCGTVFGIPCEAWEVKPEDVENMMPPADFFACWQNGEQKQWPPEPENPEPGEPPEI